MNTPPANPDFTNIPPEEERAEQIAEQVYANRTGQFRSIEERDAYFAFCERQTMLNLPYAGLEAWRASLPLREALKATATPEARALADPRTQPSQAHADIRAALENFLLEPVFVWEYALQAKIKQFREDWQKANNLTNSQQEVDNIRAALEDFFASPHTEELARLNGLLHQFQIDTSIPYSVSRHSMTLPSFSDPHRYPATDPPELNKMGTPINPGKSERFDEPR